MFYLIFNIAINILTVSIYFLNLFVYVNFAQGLLVIGVLFLKGPHLNELTVCLSVCQSIMEYVEYSSF